MFRLVVSLVIFLLSVLSAFANSEFQGVKDARLVRMRINGERRSVLSIRFDEHGAQESRYLVTTGKELLDEFKRPQKRLLVNGLWKKSNLEDPVTGKAEDIRSHFAGTVEVNEVYRCRENRMKRRQVILQQKDGQWYAIWLKETGINAQTYSQKVVEFALTIDESADFSEADLKEGAEALLYGRYRRGGKKGWVLGQSLVNIQSSETSHSDDESINEQTNSERPQGYGEVIEEALASANDDF